MKRWMVLLAVIALVAAACSSASNDGVATLDATTTTIGDAAGADTGETDQEALLAFAACMRDNGVEDFQDPIVNADGSVDFGFRPGAQGDDDLFGGVDREIVRGAFEQCSDNLEGVAFGPGGTEFNLSEIQDTFVEFAACMRDNGVEMDDPDFSNFGPGNGGDGDGPFASLDLTDPDVQDALGECQSVFGDFLPGGPGRGSGTG
ncbi:MAG: hypothetical protein ACC654_05645 [Acidimicrobiia bacterium]